MVKAKKALGQNFLENKNILKRIVGLLDYDLPVVEIGAGPGYLTKLLAEKYQVTAIEKDERFESRLNLINNVRVVMGDVLNLDLVKILPDPYQLIGNLPYNVSKKIIQLFFKQADLPEKAVFLIQREVADELCQSKKSLFSLSVEFYCFPRREFLVKAGSFKPKPKVDGRVIVLENFCYPLPFKLKREKIEKNFFRLLRFGFSSPRKKLINNLAVGLKVEKLILQNLLEKATIKKDARAEDVSFLNWLKIYQFIYEKGFGKASSRQS